MNHQAICGRLALISYNIAGLPIPRQYDAVWRLPWQRASHISRQIGASGCTLFAAQEDFNTHRQLARHLQAFPFRSCSSGVIPQGDGLNVFSKLPIYNVIRIPWEQYYGVFDGASDALSNKGFMVCSLEIAKGVFLHFYNVHTGAADDAQSIAARKDNYRQLAEFINSYSRSRAVLVTGDFNSNLRREESQLCRCLLEPTGLTDVWAQLHNQGRCTGLRDTPPEDITGDGLDRVLYRNGGGVSLRPLTHRLQQLYDPKGVPLSDHASCQVELEFSSDGSPQPPAVLELPAPPGFGQRLRSGCTHGAKALGLLLREALPK